MQIAVQPSHCISTPSLFNAPGFRVFCWDLWLAITYGRHWHRFRFLLLNTAFHNLHAGVVGGLSFIQLAAYHEYLIGYILI
uniref:Uncharacterized protein n=1 Tax=Oryza brachyantha TaxID=4533 RepID=J3KV86_ORYBR